jgi:NAD(P)H dehydrogenase (quinone)
LAHPSGDSALHILRTDLATVHSPTEKGFSEPISVEYIREPPLFDPEPGFPQTRAMIAAFRQALLHARPPKVVVLSTIGADAERPNLLNGLRFLEEALADVDLPISFLRAAWFMENAEWDIPSARENGVIHSYLQPLDRKVAMIATDDVGRTAAELLLEEWRGHRVIEIEAQERVSPNDVAAALAQALGRPVEAEPTPRDQWEAIFRAQGMRNPLPRMQMLDGFNEGWIDFNGNNSDKRKGSIAICQAIDALVRKSAT